jgi:hypothetical protein
MYICSMYKEVCKCIVYLVYPVSILVYPLEYIELNAEAKRSQ